MFVKDFQLKKTGENCHKTKLVSKCGKNIMFFLKTLVNFLSKQGFSDRIFVSNIRDQNSVKIHHSMVTNPILTLFQPNNRTQALSTTVG